MSWKKLLITTAAASMIAMPSFTSPAKAFPIADYSWSDEKWAEVTEDIRTSYNPKGPLNTEELTITVDDERFEDFIYWVWNNKIDEHQVEMIGGSEWDGPTNGVIFHWAPGSRWEKHTVMPFDMAIGHVTGEHQWYDSQFPEFFEQYGGAKGVNIKTRLSVDQAPTWGEFVNFIGDPDGEYYRYLYHQEIGMDPEKQLIYMMGGNGVAFTYTFQRYLNELKEVLTDAKVYQFFQMYDELGKGFAVKPGWAGNPVPKLAEVATTASVKSEIARANESEYMYDAKTEFSGQVVSVQPGKGIYKGNNVVEVKVNGSKLYSQTPSINLGGSTYTPLRELSSALQYQYAYHKASNTIYAGESVPDLVDVKTKAKTYQGYKTVNLVVNGMAVTEKPSVIIGNTLYVPIRAYSDAFDLNITWKSKQDVEEYNGFKAAVAKMKEDWTGGTIPLDQFTGEIKEFDMEIHSIKQEIAPGVVEEMWGYGLKGEQATVPGPVLRVQKGDLVRINFTNTHDRPHSIHTHGMNSVNTSNDGVPSLSKHVLPGETYTYEFVATDAGTFGYHCHVETQLHLQMGMIGALVVEDPEEQKLVDKDFTLVLSEWDKDRIPEIPEHHPEYDYYLINGKTLPAVPSLDIKEGEIARVRLVNLGSKVHSLHLHGSTFLVTQKDANQIPAPYKEDTVMIGPGQRIDLLVKGRDGKFIWHDHNTNQEGMFLEVHGSPEKKHSH